MSTMNVVGSLFQLLTSNFLFLGFRREPVPHPRLTEQVPRRGRIWLDLLTQLRDQRPDVLGLFDRVRSPDRLQDHTMREHAVMIAREQREQLELLRRETD